MSPEKISTTRLARAATDGARGPGAGAAGGDPSGAPALPVTVEREIPPEWTDYNGHMNELHYMEAAARANDRFMEMIGADAAYVAGGHSYFTVENHICYLGEMQAGERLRVTTQVLSGAGKKMLLFHRILNGEGAVCATVESMQLHVDLATRRTCAPGAAVAERLGAWAAAHAALPRPAQAGRGIGGQR